MFRRFGLVLVAALLCTSVARANNSYSGPITPLGNGTAHLVLLTDANDKPTSLTLILEHGALTNLPPNEKREGEWTYLVPKPPGPNTGIDHVTIDWNPHGHDPKGIYSVPHFDFHFYMVDRKHQLAIAFPKQDKDPAARVSNRTIIPPGYEVVPMTAVPGMGVHAIDPASPEFHGERFTSTFLYGYYNGKLIFLEPMITRAFLKSHPYATFHIPAPPKTSYPGYYPTVYRVMYAPKHRNYAIELTGFKHFN